MSKDKDKKKDVEIISKGEPGSTKTYIGGAPVKGVTGIEISITPDTFNAALILNKTDVQIETELKNIVCISLDGTPYNLVKQ